MKVYNLPIEKNHSFVFYDNEFNELTCVNDIDNPQPPTYLCWSPEKLFYKEKMPIGDRVSIPVIKIKDEDCFTYIKSHILDLYKLAVERYDDFNVFICYKDLEDDFIEIGITAYKATGKHINEPMTKYLQKHIDLQIFA